ncbi:MAG: hypothetical protein AAGI88_05330 [Pseudomonadota bacterium]
MTPKEILGLLRHGAYSEIPSSAMSEEKEALAAVSRLFGFDAPADFLAWAGRDPATTLEETEAEKEWLVALLEGMESSAEDVLKDVMHEQELIEALRDHSARKMARRESNSPEDAEWFRRRFEKENLLNVGRFRSSANALDCDE